MWNWYIDRLNFFAKSEETHAWLKKIVAGLNEARSAVEIQLVTSGFCLDNLQELLWSDGSAYYLRRAIEKEVFGYSRGGPSDGMHNSVEIEALIYILRSHSSNGVVIAGAAHCDVLQTLLEREGYKRVYEEGTHWNKILRECTDREREERDRLENVQPAGGAGLGEATRSEIIRSVVEQYTIPPESCAMFTRSKEELNELFASWSPSSDSEVGTEPGVGGADVQKSTLDSIGEGLAALVD